jgi:hypothetical protein
MIKVDWLMLPPYCTRVIRNRERFARWADRALIGAPGQAQQNDGHHWETQAAQNLFLAGSVRIGCSNSICFLKVWH